MLSTDLIAIHDAATTVTGSYWLKTIALQAVINKNNPNIKMIIFVIIKISFARPQPKCWTKNSLIEVSLCAIIEKMSISAIIWIIWLSYENVINALSLLVMVFSLFNKTMIIFISY